MKIGNKIDEPCEISPEKYCESRNKGTVNFNESVEAFHDSNSSDAKYNTRLDKLFTHILLFYKYFSFS